MTSPFDAISGSPLDIFASEALPVAGAAVGFTEGTMAPGGAPTATAAFVTVEGASIRALATGTDPTATVGTPFNVGDTFVVWGRRDLMSIRFIRQGGVSATLSTEFAR